MKICFVGSADGIISVPFFIYAFVLFMSVFILFFVFGHIKENNLNKNGIKNKK